MGCRSTTYISHILIVFCQFLCISNGAAPVFTNIDSGSSVSIGETTTGSYLLFTVTATDTDPGTITYSLVQAPASPAKFNFTDANIYVTGGVTFDYEDPTDQLYTLTITAATTSGGGPTDGTLTVHIVDEDDEAPVIAGTYTGSVNEEQDIGTLIVVPFSVTDVDTDDTVLIYSISGDDTNFQIDSTSGEITTREVIDFETSTASFSVILRVEDPVGNFATQSLTITLTDINDNTPAFTNSFYTATVVENEGQGLSVKQVVAYDDDAIDTVIYNITAGDDDINKFTMSGNEIRTTSTALDYDELSGQNFIYTLKVEATDGTKASTATVFITITAVNDHTPVWDTFDPPWVDATTAISIDENSPVGTTIVTASATDGDAGIDGTLTFSIVSVTASSAGVSSGLFNMDSASGALSVISATLDRDTATGGSEYYDVVISVTDQGDPSLAVQRPVRVGLNDLNDIAPTFGQNLYTASFPEGLSSVGTSIITVSATDNDETPSTLTYSIDPSSTPSEYSTFFEMDAATPNQINVKAEVDLDIYNQHPASYTLFIAVDDGSLSSTTQVSVTVTTVNEYTPANALELTSTPNENEVIGSSIGIMSADDRDLGGYDSVITYTIIDGDPNGQFFLDASSGEFFILSELDYETTQVHTLVVKRTDGGSSPKSSTGTMTVSVQDVSDTAPTCTDASINVNFAETELATYLVTQVDCTDPDTVDTLTFAISSVNNGEFAINNTGALTLAQAIDYDAGTYTFQLTIDVTDTTTTVQVAVNIEVTAVNEMTPLFPAAQTVNYYEGTAIGTQLITFAATDTDSSPHNIQTYEISAVSNSGIGVFTIDANDATISLAAELDFESLPTSNEQYVITILAIDGGTIPTPETGTGSVTIVVDDVNDSTPECRPSSQVKSVAEDEVAGYVVVSDFVCTDGDAGTTLQYLILSQIPSDHFEMDITGTPKLVSSSDLDYEAISDYYIELSVSDGTLLTTVYIDITVTDVNDGGPTFNSPSYSATIPEDEALENYVAAVTATDPDLATSTYGKLTYSVISGNTDNAFSIDPTSGRVTVGNTLNAEAVTEYSLVVQVIEDVGTNSATVRLNITVTDVNDNPPTCTSPEAFSASMIEEGTIGDQIFVLTCTDVDAGDSLTYTMTNGDPYFQLNGNVVELLIPIDYDTVATTQFDITIDVTDGINTLTIDGSVAVSGDNEVPPAFSQTIYSVTKAENTATGTLITTVTANDDDKGDTITYAWVTSTSDFTLYPTNGKIILAGDLNFEITPDYSLLVEASDGTNAVTATVTITVTDQNDNAPIFSPNSYSTILPETTLSGAIATTVTATDADDSGSNDYGTLTYSITSVGAPFAIDGSTGVITTTEDMNYETDTSYLFYVQAIDSLSADGAKSAQVAVHVIVESVNEDTPTFTMGTYTANVVESYTVGRSLTQVVADDTDAGDDGLVYYSMTLQTYFSLDTSTGDIALKDLIDFDSDPSQSYSFEVVAHDSGTVPKSSAAMVSITVSDANDNAPSCTQSLFSVSFAENTGDGTTMATFVCTDDDSTPNDVLTYTITFVNSVSDATPFTVDGSGIVALSGGFDYEGETKYEILVEVKDGGTSSLSTTVTVHVAVTDKNENDPVYSLLPYNQNVIESIAIHTSVYKVTATDADAGETVTFSLQSPNSYFAIDSTTGNIYSTATIDYDTITISTNPIELVVLATDSGTDPALRTATATVTLTITNFNDLSPVFNPLIYTGSVSENEVVGFTVTTVAATDADDASVTYTIDSGNTDTVFGVEANGDIKIVDRTNLDYDAGLQHYTLVVQAADPGGLTGTASVYVEVTNYNDNAPTFDVTSTTVNIAENSATGTSVHDIVDATDDDVGDDGHIQYSFLSGDDGKFSINSVSGLVSVSGELDMETTTQYTIIVEATDEGTNPGALTASFTLTVDIDDENDVAPSCGLLYTSTIPENSGAGTSVAQLACTDGDVSVANNGINSYTLTGGHVGGEFAISGSGEVTTTGAVLDREATPFYDLTIDVDDTGSSSLTSVVSLRVTLEDENDMTPVFESVLYSWSTPEDSPITFAIGTVTATDSDSGDNGAITYTIFSGNTAGKFALDSSTGELKLANSLDFETDVSNTYELVIHAIDQGTAPETGTTTVSVTVSDVNDEFPQCSETNYVTSVVENSAGATVATVACTDVDAVGTALTYIITSGNSFKRRKRATDHFAIDSSGVMTTAVALDAEVIPEYILTVDVSDGTNTKTVEVQVSVTDENEDAPAFDPTGPYTQNINEEEAGGYLVFNINAADPDITSGTLSYTITDGNIDGKFVIDAESGEINIAQNIDRESLVTTNYNLTIKVADGTGAGSFMSTTYIIINIDDVNDNAPDCDKSTYTTSLDEDTSNGMTVITPTCTDVDVNASPTLLYSITAGNTNTVFDINSASGVVTTQSSLNYEAVTEYSLTVLVDDQGTAALTTTLTMSIHIGPVNEATPAFTSVSYTMTVAENSVQGTQVVQVAATDADLGNKDGDIAFSITAGNDDNHFMVDTIDGWITVAGDIDREVKDTYTLTLQATDSDVGDAGALFSTVTVTVTVTDENDEKPTCQPTTLYVSFAENTASSTAMTNLACSDNDLSPYSDLTYSILTVNSVSSTLFEVSAAASVTLSGTGAFDYEAETSYEIAIEVSDGGIPSLSTTATVLVLVTDVNEEVPVFQNIPYAMNVVENTPKGDIVFGVTATDADTADNVTYSINPTSTLFEIEPVTGKVYTIAELDFETLGGSGIDVVVVATDDGTPLQYSDSTTLVISIINANDVSPIFSPSYYVTSVSENEGAETTVITVTATDNDDVTLTYSIDTGNEDGVFRIESPGNIIIDSVANFDYDSPVQDYRLHVHAVDTSSHTGSTIVTITVENYNDNMPVLASSSSSPSIPEDEANGYIVVTVDATDDDYGTDGDITYSIASGNDDGKFAINAATGVVTLAQELDRESVTDYSVVIYATDSGTNPGANSAQYTLTVTVSDVNDWYPECDKSTYPVTIAEDITASDTVVQLNCIDNDDDLANLNNLISFVKTSGDDSNHFIISAAGTVTPNAGMDREANPTYSILIEVRDGGSSPLTTTVKILVTVTDVNDADPAFTLDPYNMDVDESAARGDVVGTVLANDADTGTNGAVTYSIASGNDAGKYEVDSSSGEIKLVTLLDYETDSSSYYILVVNAVDQGIPAKSDSTTVLLTVNDVNDVAPSCAEATYQAPVAENSVSATVLTPVCDGGDTVDSTLVYSITDGNTAGYFGIDSNTGVITTVSGLDAEGTADFILTVQVNDGTITSEVSVHVSVTDVNEAAPTFDPPGPYVIDIDEEEAVGFLVYDVNAVDSDATADALVFAVTNGNMDSMYIIDSGSGEIQIAKVIDRETISQTFYNLTLAVSDGTGAGSLTSTTSMIININDINDNEPTCDVLQYVTSLTEDTGSGSAVISPICSDLDVIASSPLLFAITNGNTAGKFQINTGTGAVTTAADLDYETDTEYILTVTVDDQGASNFVLTVTMTIHIDPINEETPTFVPATYSVSIPENSAPPAQVVQLAATDTDLGNMHGDVTFSITAGNDDGQFSVDSSTGWITVVGDLDREATDGYVLSVQAKDSDVGAADARSSATSVTITVLDENDNSPVCTPTPLSVSVAESTASPATITTLVCTDIDLSPNSDLTYTIKTVNDISTTTPFSVDSVGDVTSTLDFNYESEVLYKVTIETSDGGSVSLSTTSTVYVHVTDDNEYAPAFQGIPYDINVQEGTAVGNNVFVVTATDGDTANNVTYSLDPTNSFFAIDSVTAMVYITATLDFDPLASTSMELVVVATDDGSPSRSASETLTVSITDLNDESPVFNPAVYTTSISENDAAETFVVQVTATDIDDLVLTYSFDSGNEDNVFRIESNGNIIIDSIANLDYDLLTRSYRLVALAVDDAFHTGSTIVTITVENYNDNTPVLASSSSSASIAEDEAVGYIVVNVDATDDDYGTDGDITYSIASGNDDGKFAINAATGVVTLAQELDRESVTDYSVVISATDSGTNPGAKTAEYTLTVSVADVNDFSPNCTQSLYSASIPENQPIGTSVAQLTCSDLDDDPAGFNNAVTTFTVMSGNTLDTFFIWPSGEVETAKLLDREVTPSYNLVVEVIDFGSLPLTATTTLTFTIIDVNDEPPVFTLDPYNFYVDENSSYGAIVGTVTATDTDTGDNGVIGYSIFSGNDDGQFTIDSGSGEILLIGSLDYEATVSYILEVRAIDEGIPANTGTTTTTVNVNDINDESPTCTPDVYTGSVAEGVGTGTVVATAVCHDTDTVNPTLTYTISNGITEFVVDSNGEVTTNAVLDVETVDFYTIRIDVTDGTFTTTVVVTVTVDDVNDETPYFDPLGSYSTLIPEEEAIGYIVYTLAAADADITQSTISFAITAGNIGSEFQIDQQSGMVTLAAQIDRDDPLTTLFTLTIEISDGTHSTDTSLTVNIDDINDNYPVCDSETYIARLDENVGFGTAVVSPNCDDLDIVASPVLLFAITAGNTGSTFTINPATGAITIDQSPDYETDSSYRLTVTVDDQATSNLVTTLTVAVVVDALNEDTPTFGSPTYTTSVAEDQVDVAVFTATATDTDTGSNHGDVTYAITAGNGDGHFSIDSSTGIVSVVEYLDRENIDTYTLTIEATDANGGAGALSSDTQLTITVMDVNDNKPICTSTPPATYAENTALTTTLATIVCTDIDISPNSDLTYAIMTVNNVVTAEPFSIDSSGVMTLDSALNYETTSYYSVVIKVNDGGTLSYATTTVVIIQVTDVNDFYPVFQGTSYSTNVPESTAVGMDIFVVTATDGDTADSITYSISPASSYFAVDANDGKVYTIETQDFDTIVSATIELVVVATDSGSPAHSTSTTLSVTITDTNDGVPAFTAGGFVATISENEEVQKTVLIASANDIDDTDLTYSIISGNGDNVFRIESPGNIILDDITNLDYDTSAQNYLLKIQAVDSASNTGTAIVTITVTSYNDNVPIVSPTTSAYSIAEDEPIGFFIEDVYATDADAGSDGEITYSITSGNDDNKFSINPTDGIVTLADELDMETMAGYTVVVHATDHGTDPGALSASHVITITVTDVNDFTPECTKSLYTVTISEDHTAQTSVAQLACSDGDANSPNNLVNSYSKISGDTGGDFSISSSGELTTNVALDRETIGVYTLVIDVADSGSSPRTTTATIVVTLTDVNDEVPTFGSTIYSFNTDEDTVAGTSVGSVDATDLDSGLAGAFIFGIDSGNSLGKFSLDRISGELQLLQELDYESNTIHTLIVHATDKGNAANTGSATISFTVNDVNDRYPLCTSSLYTGSVAEDEIAGINVVTVQCSDTVDTVGSTITFSTSNTDFVVDTNTGVVSTNVALDIEATDTYTFVVTASDDLLMTDVEVQVTITDVNEHFPEFTGAAPYFDTVQEDVSIGYIVRDIDATDLEYSSTTFVYAITDGNTGSVFKIDRSSGIIQTQTALDRDSPLMTSYTLRIEAADGTGADALTSTTTLEISLDDVNDNWPVCDQIIYHGSFLESVVDGTNIASPSCDDLDVFASPTLAYAITSGNEDDKFKINVGTGVIDTKAALDYETSTDYELIVEVDDQAASGALTTTLTVLVTVEPVNEVNPVFSAAYTQSVGEGASQGDSIVLIVATDTDTGVLNHGIVRYEITDGNVEGHFSINPSTGLLSVAAKLNRESKASYTLTVRATDSDPGAADARFAETTVDITVTDVNDNYPVFNPKFYLESVVESATIGATLFQVTATDDDEGQAGTDGLLYSIVDGNTAVKFGMDANEVTLAGDIDAMTASSYTITIEAKDQGTPALSAQAIMTIQIIPSNEHAPVFTVADDAMYLSEETEVGTSLYQVSASDADTGSFAELCYYFDSGNEDNIFDVNQYNGDVKVANRLNFDTSPTQYIILFRVQDTCEATGATKSATMTLTINLTDENDETPLFTENNYVLTVNENEPISSSAFSVSATDGDSGVNSDITYTVMSGTGMSVFTIDSTTGVGQVAGVIDYETLQTYDLVVFATDGGSSPLSSQSSVQISINDLNDEVPTYDFSELAVTIAEDRPKDDVIMSITATDEDSTDNNNNIITYSMSPASTYFTYVDGYITVSNPLDRETLDRHILTLLATDGGTNPTTNTGTMTLTVIISDVNDNDPVVTGSYDATVSEDEADNYVVFTIAATDADDGVNAILTYAITSGDSNNDFRIDSGSGLVQTQGGLDRETIDLYTLEITVTDGGLPALSAVLSATVTVTDANDNAPIFQPDPTTEYSLSIYENEAAGSTVAQVIATDGDTGTNGIVSYSIVSFTTGSSAHIAVNAATGDITTTIMLDRETMDAYKFVVRAMDGGTTALSSSATVSITVLDRDDQVPQFGQTEYIANTKENQAVGTSILSVVVSDADLAASTNIIYSIESGTRAAQYIDIDSATSVLSVKQVIDRENDDSFIFNLTATDDAGLKTTSLITITVDDENDNYPIFSPVFYNTEVAYNDECQTTMAVLTATDADAGVNADFAFVVSQNPAPSVFALGTSNGDITIISEAEESRKYILYVTATDRGDPPQSAATEATIRIDSYDATLVVVDYYLGMSRTEFLTQEATFLSQLLAVYQATYPTSEVKRWCVTAQSTSSCIVHTYVLNFVNTTDERSETDNVKTFLLMDEAFSVTSADTSGTPGNTITGTSWTPFAITKVGKYSTASSSSDDDKTWIIAMLCSIAGLIIAALGAAAGLYYKKTRKRPPSVYKNQKNLRSISPISTIDLESEGDYVSKNQYQPKDNLRRMFNEKNSAVSNEKFKSDNFVPMAMVGGLSMPAAKRFPMQIGNTAGDKPDVNTNSFFQQQQNKPTVPELRKDERVNPFDSTRPFGIGIPPAKKFPMQMPNNSMTKPNSSVLSKTSHPERKRKARAEEEESTASQAQSRTPESGSQSRSVYSGGLYTPASTAPIIVNRQFDGRAIDAKTGRLYEYNTQTNERRWVNAPDNQQIKSKRSEWDP